MSIKSYIATVISEDLVQEEKVETAPQPVKKKAAKKGIYPICYPAHFNERK